jgi:hypothetical protein
MAVPTYIFSDSFESGSAAAWDVAESDTDSQLDFPHYSELARFPGIAMPAHGAYCARWTMGAVTGDATIGDASITIADGETIWVRFSIWISPDTATLSTANDSVPILEFQRTTANAVIYSFGFQVFAATDLITWNVGEATPSLQVPGNAQLGVWNTIELMLNVQTGAATGDVELYVTPEGEEPSTTAVRSAGSIQNAAAVVRAILGTQDKLATTLGTVLVDDFVVDNARIWPNRSRFSNVRQITGSSHAFIGPGTVEAVVLSSSAVADNVVAIYDTDTAQAHQGLKKLSLSNTVASEVVSANSVPFHVTRGCYVEIAGTGSPEVMVTIRDAPASMSDGGMRNFANKRSV